MGLKFINVVKVSAGSASDLIKSKTRESWSLVSLIQMAARVVQLKHTRKISVWIYGGAKWSL